MTRVPPPRILMALMATIERTTMLEEVSTDALQARLDILTDNVNALVDEKAELSAANMRLAEQLKAVIAEKGELEQKLKRLDGMGVQQNNPEAFSQLAAAAGAGNQTL